MLTTLAVSGQPAPCQGCTPSVLLNCNSRPVASPAPACGPAVPELAPQCSNRAPPHPLMAAADHGFVVRSRTVMSRPITYLVMEDEFPLGCCTTRAPANSTGMSGALIGIM